MCDRIGYNRVAKIVTMRTRSRALLRNHAVNQSINTGSRPAWSCTEESPLTPPDKNEQAQEPERPARTIARRVAIGFSSISIVAIAMCGMLISLISDVAGLVSDMRADEAGIKESLALATSVREQYIHQAHWLIERDDEHLHHYEDWVVNVKDKVAALRPLVPVSQLRRLEGVARDSLELDALFRTSIQPAARRGHRQQLVELHRQADALSQRATRAADSIAQSVEARMAMAHTSATRTTRRGLLTGMVCVALVLALAVMFTIQLRRVVLKPLDVLARAAREFGTGGFHSRLGKIGEGELLAVARAFDRMADELETRERKLIESERMAAIGQLAAGVAHEINNPIQVIRGYLKTMGPDSPHDTLIEELQILDEEAAACQRIAEDLVAYSRAPDVKSQSLNIEEFLAENIRRFRETLEGREHQVDDELEPATILADGTRLRQVVLNLLLNAAQVSGTSEVITVVGREKSSGGYCISVMDRGPGIDDADKARIFEPFFTKRAGGSGLGLAVCQGIVRAHGGTIAVFDRPDGGTIVRVELPGIPTSRMETA